MIHWLFSDVYKYLSYMLPSFRYFTYSAFQFWAGKITVCSSRYQLNQFLPSCQGSLYWGSINKKKQMGLTNTPEQCVRLALLYLTESHSYYTFLVQSSGQPCMRKQQTGFFSPYTSSKVHVQFYTRSLNPGLSPGRPVCHLHATGSCPG